MVVLFAWLLADFISGLVHWWEDRAFIGSSRFKFINGIREDNERHHKMPGYFLKLSWWENINTTAPIAWILTVLLYFAEASLFVTLTIFFLGLGNLVHRWAHEPRNKLPVLVRYLQIVGLFSSMNHHNGHHFYQGKALSREESRIRYCVMTNWLNPILDGIGFFKLLERFL